MKQISIAAAFLAVGVTAQNATLTTTSYYNTCIASGIVTATDTLTYCPPCEAAGMTSFPGGSLTTYVTRYSQVCPTGTGLEEATYTVTEPCPSTGLARGPSHIPQGFTVTTVPCSVCEAGKSQYAQTTPGPALASALAAPAAVPAVPTSGAEAGKAAPPSAAAPAAAPGAAGSPGAAGAPGAAGSPGAAGAPAPAAAGAASPANAENAATAPGSSAPGAAAPSENGAAAPAENGAAAPAGSSAGAPAPYPLPSQAGQVGAASGAPASNGNSTVPFRGAANLVSAAQISSFITALATLITGFVFVL